MKIKYMEIIKEFISNHGDLFDISKYDDDTKKINIEPIDQYIKQQDSGIEFLNLYKTLYTGSQYISFDMMMTVLNANILELKTLEKTHKLVLLFNIDETNKSSFFFNMFFLYLYKDFNNILIIPYRFDLDEEYTKSIVKWNSYYYDKLKQYTGEVVYIVCDDFLYSGSQMVETIFYHSKFFIHNNEYKTKKINVFLNVIGYTEVAQMRLKNVMINDFRIMTKFDINLILPKQLIKSNNNIINMLIKPHIKIPKRIITQADIMHIYKNFLINKDVYICFKSIKKISTKKIRATSATSATSETPIRKKLILQSVLLFLLMHYGHLTTIYLFFKYPDGVSTFRELCLFPNFGKQYTCFIEGKDIEKLKQEKTIKPLTLYVTSYKITNKEHCELLHTYFDKPIIKNRNIIKNSIPYIKFFNTKIKEDKFIQTIKDCNLSKYKPNYNHFDIRLFCNTSCLSPFYKSINYATLFRELSRKLINEKRKTLKTRIFNFVKNVKRKFFTNKKHPRIPKFSR